MPTRYRKLTKLYIPPGNAGILLSDFYNALGKMPNGAVIKEIKWGGDTYDTVVTLETDSGEVRDA